MRRSKSGPVAGLVRAGIPVLVATVLASGCGSDEPSASAKGGTGGSGTGGSSDSGASGGSGGDGAAGGNAGGGQAGAPACPDTTPPTVVTEIPGAGFPGPGDYQGGDAPLLDLDHPDPTWTWNDPHVLKVGAQYWMYASATVNFTFPVRLYRLVSNDGESWARDPEEPILEPGEPGTWDAGGVETPAVVFFGGQYHLFYTGYPAKVGDPDHSVLDFRVGHATSCDGVNWARTADPVVVPSGSSDSDPDNDWYAFVVGEPGPVVHDDELLLFFTAFGVSASLGTTLQVIGVTSSADGTTWSAPALALAPDQGQYPRVTDAGPPLGGWTGYSTPNAMVLNGQVHLFVDIAFDPDEAHWQQVRLHHAVSPDGLTGWVQDAAAIASAGDFAWATDEIRAPDAMIDGSTLRLYFAGHELDGTAPEHFAIGMMSYELGGQ